MADDNKVTEGSSAADEWDMLSLTSSVYTAPLFRRGFDPVYVPEYGNVSNSQQGPYPGLFTSDDFVFPPSEHENLPIESEPDELNTSNDGQEGSCAGNFVGCNELPKEVDDRSDENVSVSNDLLSANETTSSDLKTPEIHPGQEKDNTNCKSDLPCEAWWKRKSMYLCHHIKGVTTFCSIVAAGALVGFVIMGQRWQQNKWHLHQFQFSVSGESMNRIIGLFSRWKDGVTGTNQQLRSLLPTRVFPQQQLSA